MLNSEENSSVPAMVTEKPKLVHQLPEDTDVREPTIIDTRKTPSGPPGWEIVFHRANGLVTFNASRLGLLEKATKNEKDFNIATFGRDLHKRLYGDLTIVLMDANMADHFDAHPDMYPEEYKRNAQGKPICVFYWAHVFSTPESKLYVRGHTWDDGYGLLSITRSLDSSWGPDDYVAIHLPEQPLVEVAITE